MSAGRWRILEAVETVLQRAAAREDWERVCALGALRDRIEAQWPDAPAGEAVLDLYSIVDRDAGPARTFLRRDEAEAELAAMLRDEPGWAGHVWVERFTLRVATDRGGQD